MCVPCTGGGGAVGGGTPSSSGNGSATSPTGGGGANVSSSSAASASARDFFALPAMARLTLTCQGADADSVQGFLSLRRL